MHLNFANNIVWVCNYYFRKLIINKKKNIKNTNFDMANSKRQNNKLALII